MTIDRAVELWDAIIESAGLDLELYDHDFLVELAAVLGLNSGDFRKGLDEAGITAQVLLEAVLQQIAPYAAMQTEILTFFARAGARSSSANLRIRFDFEKAGENFEFDLENFRDWESQFREALTTIALDEIDDLLALQIRHAFIERGLTYEVVGSRWVDMPVLDGAAAEWLHGTTQSARALPPPPAVANAALRAFLARVWSLLRMAMQDEGDSLLSDDDLRTIVRGAYLLRGREELLLARLESLFADVLTRSVDTVGLLEELRSLFNLPVWQRRSEIYSIWVGARLMSALGDATHVHVVDRTLVFAFGGSHLATVRLPNGENLHVWCELRTEATAGVVGKGRTKRIQPDYVVCREPITHPDSAVLVVECKQYLKQSRSAFANALIDYTRNHRSAVVVLVNYGPTTTSVLGLVAAETPDVVSRARVVGMFRPRSGGAIDEFEALARAVLPPPPSPLAMTEPTHSDITPAAPSRAGTLRLAWKAAADLDLHCWVTDAGGHREHVCYSQKTLSVGAAKVALDRDVQTGGDAETLTWQDADDFVLDFAVHVYSPDVGIKSTEPLAEVRASDCTWTLRPPSGVVGKWWNLFRIERGGSSIQIWNAVAETELSEVTT